jgi:hypothetical protein
MGTYLDKLSLSLIDDDDDNAVSNEALQNLNACLFGYQPYVVMTMNYKHTGKLDVNEARRCILHIWRKCGVDIKTCCRIFLESFENFMDLAGTLQPTFNELIAKYEEK